MPVGRTATSRFGEVLADFGGDWNAGEVGHAVQDGSAGDFFEREDGGGVRGGCGVVVDGWVEFEFFALCELGDLGEFVPRVVG